MRHRGFLFVIGAVIQAATANADDFADIDPVKLAKSIEKLAEAWSIETVVAKGATDDFASDELFQAKEPTEAADTKPGNDNRGAALERTLLGLGTGAKTSFELDKVGRR